ncbi:MAG TPA: cytochrome c biogenesis heme-transporting ATPase CcmA [Burkholderiales bacterium]|jgi:heme exporter protein A|nr:cytochrome c biogenesis heme-transporting ATPase CcmA [Burkholderiales bacterium]
MPRAFNPPSMLQAVDLSCIRGTRRLFQCLGFSISAGEALCVRGENGAGKTSLLRILAGLSQPATGEVRWRDAPIARCREAYAAQLVFIGHANALKEDLSAVENLRAASALAGVACDAEAVRAGLSAEGLNDVADLPVQWLSQGQRRRVALTRLALSRGQPLWILDEPFSALDQTAVQRVCRRIEAHAAQGGVVVFTTHQDVELSVQSRSLELR